MGFNSGFKGLNITDNTF